MLICPLTQKECLESRCMWYVPVPVDENGTILNCAIALIAKAMYKNRGK